MKLFYLFFISIIVLVNHNLNAQNTFWESYSLAGHEVWQIATDRQNNYYAVIDSTFNQSLLKSNDGISWYPIFFSDARELEILIDTTNYNFDKIYAFKKYYTSVNSDTLYFSTDYGATWNLFPLPADSSSFSVRQIAYNPDGDLYLNRFGSIYFTNNDGSSWNILPTGSYNVYHLIIDMLGNIYIGDVEFSPYAGYVETIYKTENNGASWSNEISSWGHGTEFGAVESLPTGEIYAGIYNYIYLKKNPNEPWINIEADIDPGSMVVNKYKDLFVSKNFYTGNIMPSRYSPDYGITWFNFDNGLLEILNMVLDEKGYLYAATPTGIFRSTGSTFPITDKFSINFIQTALNDTASEEISIFNPFDTLLIVDSLSFNTGNFFGNITNPILLLPGDSDLVTLYFSPDRWGIYDDTLTIYSNLKTANVFLSGESPLPQLITTPSLSHLSFGNTYLDSTKSKTLKITNHSINYLEIDSIYTRCPQFNVSSLNYPIRIARDSITFNVLFQPDSAINYFDTLFIQNNLTEYPYIIRLTGRGVKPVNTLNESGDSFKFELANNYPNPFNPTTKIKYQLAEKSKVKLSVFDLLGREISILVSKEEPAGIYEVEFDGTNLPSGVYFYRMQAGQYSATKKLLLLK